jgi:ABC-type enterochelin transport system ATPase subunit
MEPTMIIGLGRLLFEVGKYVYENVIDAENNPELDTGDKKHLFVEQAVTKHIEHLSMRDDIKDAIGEGQVSYIKEKATKQIKRTIEEAVNTLNSKGHFIKGA